MDPATGEILAMDGSASTDPDKQTAQMQGDYNAAIAPRQPGSSFKPIVYATAFEMGWYPAMIVPDHKTYYPNGNDKPYSPQNYDGTFHSGYPMTIRTAVANSFNIPAITTIQFTGLPNVLNMAGRLGLSEVASRQLNTLGPSMALGSVEVTPLHMTAAYSTFANKGVRVPTVYIQSITDNEGHEIYRFDKNKVHGQRVLSEDVAFLISSMLSDKQARYHEFFPGNPLEADRPAAVKTGTTDSFRDNWTIGYTPHLTVGVWAGNSDNTIMNNVIGITGAGPIWHEVMTYASQNYNLPPDDFVPPSNVHKGSVSALTGLMPRPGEPTVSDWFIDGTQPTLISDAPLAPPKIIICPVDQNGIPVDISQCVPDPGNRDDGNTNDGHNGHHHQSDPSDPFTFNLPPGTVLIPDQPWPPGTITIPGQSQSPGTNSTPGQSQPSGQPKATKKKH